MQTLRVGMIGFGFIGRVHAYAYLNLPLFYEELPVRGKITHICTSRPETARRGAAQVGAENAVTDYRQITENPDVDVVHICSPNHLHAEELLSAIAAGKHIYCDKPLTGTLDEAKRVQEALAGYTGTAQMTFHNRFFPATLRARQMVEEGAIGKLLEFRCAYLHSGSSDPQAPLKWKLCAAAGGGVIADLGAHALDLVEYLAGPVASILAESHIAYPDRPSVENPDRRVPVDAEDCAMMLLRTRCGALGHVEATKIATGTEDELRLETHGSDGAMRLNTMSPHHLDYYDAGRADSPLGGTRGWTAIDTGQRYEAPASKFPGPKFSIGWLRAHQACLANFLQAVAEGSKPIPGLDVGIRNQELLHAAQVSASERRWVDV